MKNITRIFLSLLVLLLPLGCGTVEKSGRVGVLSQSALLEQRVRVDSIIVRDSIFVHQKSDTVYYTKYRTLYKERLRVDTVVRCDTLFINREVVAEKSADTYCWGLARQGLPLLLLLLLLWRTGLWRILWNLIMKCIGLCIRVFRLKG